MSAFRFNTRKLCWCASIVLSVTGVHAQTCVVLSPPTIAANGTASLDLSIFSPQGKGPATLQWTFQFESSGVKNLTVDDGPALTSAGKTAICAGDGTAYNCLAAGTNTKTIGNGIVARINAVFASGAATPPVLIKSSVGASPASYLISVISKVLPTADVEAPPACRPRPETRGPNDVSGGHR
jgi:hypothetical protein